MDNSPLGPRILHYLVHDELMSTPSDNIDVGIAFSWGWANESVLGYAISSESNPEQIINTPTKIFMSQLLCSISAGAFHVISLTTDGKLYSWGRMASGRLGYFDSSQDFMSIPKLIETKDLVFSKISCGFHHSLAITDQGDLYAWGSNYSGQCGVGNKRDITQPTKVDAGPKTKFIAVAGGYYHTIAIDQDNNLWSWGTGNTGQLGQGSLVSTLTPKKITVTKSSLCTNNTTASTTTNTTTNTTTTTTTTTVAPTAPKDKSSESDEDQEIPIKFKYVAANEFNSLAITMDGDLVIWGSNKYGQIGNKKKDKAVFYSTPQLVPTTFKVRKATLGHYHVLCISDTCSLYQWGRLINPIYTSNSEEFTCIKCEPTLIDLKNRFADIASGSAHNLALTDRGHVFSWGIGDYGQLGREAEDLAKPGEIEGMYRVFHITCSAYGSFALARRDVSGSNVPFLMFLDHPSSNDEILKFKDETKLDSDESRSQNSSSGTPKLQLKITEKVIEGANAEKQRRKSSPRRKQSTHDSEEKLSNFHRNARKIATPRKKEPQQINVDISATEDRPQNQGAIIAELLKLSIEEKEILEKELLLRKRKQEIVEARHNLLLKLSGSTVD
eukprot:TRINITY_DN5168_c1_g1_i2.p1 TRINITY_DN5168_c1_g1~~TRINITY_DN5168_c1_g1_i2.p1  ORF type:complete len:612 (+),score=125.32 TRINITY_DN5168_c1_g1_i2:1558-3393(+)